MTQPEIRSEGGIILPKPFTKMVQIIFKHSGRLTLECGPDFKVEQTNGKVTGLHLDSKSQFAFIDLDEIAAIEVVK